MRRSPRAGMLINARVGASLHSRFHFIVRKISFTKRDIAMKNLRIEGGIGIPESTRKASARPKPAEITRRLTEHFTNGCRNICGY